MRFYELFTHYNTLFNPSDTVIKCFSRCTYINIAKSVITRTSYNEQIRRDLRARYIRFLLYIKKFFLGIGNHLCGRKVWGGVRIFSSFTFY